MKTFTIIILVCILFVALAVPVMAQDGGVQLPDTAQGFLELLVGLATAWIGGGAIGSWLTNLLKRLTWIPEEDRSRIAKEGAETVAVILTTGVGLLFTYLTPVANYLDVAGIWPIILAIVAATPAVFVGKLTYRLTK